MAKLDLRNATVGDLKEFLESIPDDIELSVWNVGRTGYVEGVELEYEYGCLDLNIEAESGYH